MENDDTYDAPHSPGDAPYLEPDSPYGHDSHDSPDGPDGPAGSNGPGGPHDPSGPHGPDARRYSLDELFKCKSDESFKDALFSFITTGKASKDEIKRLYDLCLSGLSESENADDNNGRGTTTRPQTLNTITSPAMPPTPKLEDELAPDLFLRYGGEEDIRTFFVDLLTSCKGPPEKVKKLFDSSILADTEDFGSIMEYARTFGLDGQYFGEGDFAMQMSQMNQMSQMSQLNQMNFDPNDMQRSQQQPNFQQTSQSLQPAAQFQPSFLSHDCQHGPSSFAPVSFADPAHFHHVPHNLDQQQDSMGSFIPPPALAQSLPQPLLGDGNDLISLGVSTAQVQDINVTPSFDRQHGLPSPVTQASSNQSEGSSTPTANVNSLNGEGDLAEVVCTLPNIDGSKCGKRCTGPKRYRSIQEHIRRAHPGSYLPGLPATEASFHAMVDTDGVVCPIRAQDGSACGHRCAGSKPHKAMQDHIHDQHPDHFISGLPANEASFRIMIDKPPCVICPLPMQDGGICNKRCFGEKRYRSMQEHIRRTHPARYIAGLHANEDSFLQMTRGAAGAAPPAQQPSAVNGGGFDSQTSRNDFRPKNQADKSQSPASSPVVQLDERPGTAEAAAAAAAAAEVASNPNDSKPLPAQVWNPSAPETGGTVSPAMLTMGPFSQPGYPQAFSTYFPFSVQQQPFQQQQLVQPFAHACLHQHAQNIGLPLSVAVQDPDPTLSRDLFNSQSSFANTQAMQTVYGAAALNASQQQVQSYGFLSGAGQVGQQQNQIAPFPPAYSNINPQPSESYPRKRKLSEANGTHAGSQEQASKKKSAPQCFDASGAVHFNPLPGWANVGHNSQPTSAIPTTTKTAPNQKATQNRMSYHHTNSPTQLTQNGKATSPSVGPSSSPKTAKKSPHTNVSPRLVPPLAAPVFGLIQEDLAHDPFPLLMATHFLVRTPGEAAIPVYYNVMKRWPTLEALATANPEEVKEMIRKLGHSNQRCEQIQKLAREWIQRAPNKDVRYGVKDYPRKGDGRDVKAGEMFGPEDQQVDFVAVEAPNKDSTDSTTRTKARGDGTSWEIGHLTFGRYSIDSWRIFCRDVLLGRAQDWMGKGREPTFQPEWMRVLPEDAKLRAYLGWMWMKKGFLWDPQTGEKTALSDEMKDVVNQEKVCYDMEGNLKVVERVNAPALNGGAGIGPAPGGAGSPSLPATE